MNFQLPMHQKTQAVLKCASYILLVTLLIGAGGCGRKLIFPDQSTIPITQQLPLDGLWRLASGDTDSIFRIDKGRMFFYEWRDPLPASSLSVIGVTTGDSRLRYATDLITRPGEIIVKDIKATSDPLTYACQSLSYDAQRHKLGFGPAEIKVASSTQIILKTLPNLDTGLGEKIEESFLRENLDNQSWLEQTLLKTEDRGSQPIKNTQEIPGQPGQNSQLKVEQPAQNPQEHVEQQATQPSVNSNAIEDKRGENPTEGRKVIAVPPDKMESNGKLSKSAKEFIGQAVRNAKKANGSVEINCPPDAPDAVVQSLVNIGADTYVDVKRNDYELVIIKP